jgi:hypothetical protein
VKIVEDQQLPLASDEVDYGFHAAAKCRPWHHNHLKLTLTKRQVLVVVFVHPILFEARGKAAFEGESDES